MFFCVCFLKSLIVILVFEFSPSLMKYHTQLLTLDMGVNGAGAGTGAGTGAGNEAEAVQSRWTLSKIGTVEERMEMDREMKSLEERLGEVGNWEARVKELDGLLRYC